MAAARPPRRRRPYGPRRRRRNCFHQNPARARGARRHGGAAQPARLPRRTKDRNHRKQYPRHLRVGRRPPDGDRRAADVAAARRHRRRDGARRPAVRAAREHRPQQRRDHLRRPALRPHRAAAAAAEAARCGGNSAAAAAAAAAAGASASAAAAEEEGGGAAAADDAAAPPSRAPKTNWTLGKGVHGRRPASAHGTRRSGGSSREVARGASWTRGLAGGSPPRAAATQHSGAVALSPGSYGAVASGASVAAAAAQLPEWNCRRRARAAAVAKVQSAWRRTSKGGDDVANAGAADVSLTISAAYMDGGGAAASPSPERRAARLAGGASAAASSPAGGRWRQSTCGAQPSRVARRARRRPRERRRVRAATRHRALRRSNGRRRRRRGGDESDLPLPGEWWRRLNKTQPMRGVALEEELRRQTRVALGVDGHAFGKGDADEGGRAG